MSTAVRLTSTEQSSYHTSADGTSVHSHDLQLEEEFSPLPPAAWSSSSSTFSSSKVRAYLESALSIRGLFTAAAICGLVVLLLLLFSPSASTDTLSSSSGAVAAENIPAPIPASSLNLNARSRKSVSGLSAFTSPEFVDLSIPLSKETLGHSVWVFLHTMAARFPDQPDDEHQQAALNLIQALPLVYPCAECAANFHDLLAKSPPRVQSRGALGNWLCNAHNDVNKRLGKDEFDCTLLDEVYPNHLR